MTVSGRPAKQENTQFGLAFLRFPIYLKLMNRLKEVFREKFQITVLIIDESGNVEEFSPTEYVQDRGAM